MFGQGIAIDDKITFLAVITGVVEKETTVARGTCSELLRGGVSIILFWMG